MANLLLLGQSVCKNLAVLGEVGCSVNVCSVFAAEPEGLGSYLNNGVINALDCDFFSGVGSGDLVGSHFVAPCLLK
jgi:hypothetical protein